MEERPFGPTRRNVPVIGQGTWNIECGDRTAALQTLRIGLDLGMTHIDTAEMYGSGAAEELVAEAITGRREQVFLVSKVLPQNASRHGTIAACERSLARLQTDYLDCYLLHWRGSFPLEETFSAFETLKSGGKILSWGVSNFDEADLDEANRLVGTEPLLCNQVLYHLQERAIEHAVLPWCRKHDAAIVAYSPFGHDAFPNSGSQGGGVLQEIAAAHEATPRQVALRFLLRDPSVFVIPKASTPEHAAENARAGDLRLSAEEIALLGAVFPLGPRPKSLPMI